jgi:hypothetical protein
LFDPLPDLSLYFHFYSFPPPDVFCAILFEFGAVGEASEWGVANGMIVKFRLALGLRVALGDRGQKLAELVLLEGVALQLPSLSLIYSHYLIIAGIISNQSTLNIGCQRCIGIFNMH